MSSSRWVGASLATSLGVAVGAAASSAFKSFQEKSLAGKVAKDTETERKQRLDRVHATHWAMKLLSDEKWNALCESRKELVANGGDVLMKAGDQADFVYIVEEGELEVVLMRDKSEAKESTKEWCVILEKGACLGELACMFGTPRQNTVRVRSKHCKLLAFPLDNVLVAFAGTSMIPQLSVLRAHSAFASLQLWDAARLCATLEEAQYAFGQTILKAGEFCKHLYMGVAGTAHCGSRQLTGNWGYGYEVLLKEAPLQIGADLVADSATLIYRLGKVDCQNVLGYEFARLRERLVNAAAEAQRKALEDQRKALEALKNEELAAQKLLFEEAQKRALEAQRLALEAKKKEEELEAAKVVWRTEALHSHWLLQSSEVLRKQIASAMYKRTFEAESTVFEQGSAGDCFYLVEDGEIEVWTAGRIKGLSSEVRTLRPTLARTLKKGDSFGELALLYNTKRTATVLVGKSGSAVLQCVDAEKIVHTLINHDNVTRTQFLQHVTCLSDLGLWNLAHIADCFVYEHIEAGKHVFKQNDLDEKFYLVHNGEAKAFIDDKVINIYKRGDSFGELALLANKPLLREMTVTAMSPLTLLVVSHKSFQTTLGTVYRAFQNKVAREKREKRLASKLQVMQDFIQSEVLYSCLLRTLVDQFLKPLRDIKGITSVDINRVFSNVEFLANLHESINEEFAASKDVGAVVLKFADSLGSYLQYVINFEEAGKHVAVLTSKNKAFQKFLTEKPADLVGGLDLMSYLAMPNQCLPRYKSCLLAILKYTNIEEDDDYEDLDLSLTKISNVAAQLVQKQKDIENESALHKIAITLGGKLPFKLQEPHRKLVAELQNLVSSDKKNWSATYRVLAFTDLLLVIKQSSGKWKACYEYSSTALSYGVQGLSLTPLSIRAKGMAATTVSESANNAACSFVFVQSSAEQLNNVTKVVQASEDWLGRQALINWKKLCTQLDTLGPVSSLENLKTGLADLERAFPVEQQRIKHARERALHVAINVPEAGHNYSKKTIRK